VVRAAIDMNGSTPAEDAIEKPVGGQFAAIIMQRRPPSVVADLDGGVRAMVGGRGLWRSQFTVPWTPYRQPGSSFKPYVYSTALMNGFTGTRSWSTARICLGNWCPQNYGHFLSRLGDR